MLIKSIVITVVILVALLVILIFIASSRWNNSAVARLNSGSRLVNTAAGTIEYAELGEGDPILVLHGSPGGYDQALVLAELLSGEHRRFIAPSRPGYLRTPLSVGESVEAQADAISSLLDSLAIQRVIVVGASGGGPVALQFALRHSEQTSGLVLLSALTQPMHIPVENMNNPLFTTTTGNWLMLNLLRLRPQMMGGDMSDPLMRQKAIQLAETTFPANVRQEGLLNDAQQFNNLPVYPLETIQIPTLVVHGSADSSLPFANAEFAANTIPGAELLVVEGGNHGLSTFTPEALTQIGDFLDRHHTG